jgi:hypothetical protein
VNEEVEEGFYSFFLLLIRLCGESFKMRGGSMKQRKIGFSVFIFLFLLPVHFSIAQAAPAAEKETATGEEPRLPQLYLGVRGGASLDFQSVQPIGNYEVGMDQSFGGEGALTVGFRPWRYIGFQAEGVFVLESFTPYRLQNGGGLHSGDRYRNIYLLFPLLVKISLSLEGFQLSPLGGLYYILPLRTTLDGVSYEDKLDLPLGVMVGVDLGHALGRGELYGSLRYGNDLGLTTVEETGLRYTRRRLIFSLGYRFILF